MSNSFIWEKEYKRTWLNNNKNDNTNKYNISEFIYNDKKKGILRHVHIMLDISYNIDRNDYLPSFRKNIINSIDKFIPTFVSENPISGLSFSCVNEKIKKISNNLDIRELLNQKGEGSFSLLNGLLGAIDHLKNLSFCKEILVITPSLVLKDPESYTDIIEMLRKNSIKVNIISLCGELMIYKRIVKSTGGDLFIPLDIDHFNHILKTLTIPGELKSTTINLIKLGFPKVIYEEGVCACHLIMNSSGYECPICKTYICSLPMECPICETQLVSSLNIAKSFQHMYPLQLFTECELGECIVCKKEAKKDCKICHSKYCDDCDFFVHDNLNFCIGCKEDTNK